MYLHTHAISHGIFGPAIGAPRRSCTCAASSCSTSPCPIYRLLLSSRTTRAASTSPVAAVPSKSCATFVSLSHTFTTALRSNRRCPSTTCGLGITSPTFSPGLQDRHLQHASLLPDGQHFVPPHLLSAQALPHDRGGVLEGQPSLLI